MITVEDFDILLDTDHSTNTYFICNDGALYYKDNTNKVWIHPVYGFMIDRINTIFSDENSPYILWLKKEIKKIILDDNFGLIVFV